MKRLIGFLLVVVAIVGGIYVGGWLFFCKPIADIITAVMAGMVVEDIAVALFKIIFGTAITEIIAVVLGIIGAHMVLSE